MEFYSGDIALFSGKSDQHRRGQKWIGNKWSQVSLIIEWGNRLALFESTKLPCCRDVETGENVNGVQVVWFTEKLAFFEGEVAVRRLQPLLDFRRREKLTEFIRSVKGKSFNDNKFVMVRGKERRNKQNDDSSFFCSQLVANALQSIDVLHKPPIGYIPLNYSPADFTSGCCLPLVVTFCYSKEVYVKR